MNLLSRAEKCICIRVLDSDVINRCIKSDLFRACEARKSACAQIQAAPEGICRVINEKLNINEKTDCISKLFK